MRVFLFSLLGFILSAQASLLIEPYAGININGGWQDDGVDSTSKFSGNMYGGRLGIQNFGFMLGLDARKGSWDIDNEAGTELNYTHYGAFVGYDFPILLRVYAEYVLAGSGQTQDGDNLIGASGFIFGAGYKFFPFLSANLESGSVAYKEVELDDGSNLEDRDEAATYILLSISAPITLGL